MWASRHVLLVISPRYSHADRAREPAARRVDYALLSLANCAAGALSNCPAGPPFYANARALLPRSDLHWFADSRNGVRRAIRFCQDVFSGGREVWVTVGRCEFERFVMNRLGEWRRTGCFLVSLCRASENTNFKKGRLKLVRKWQYPMYDHTRHLSTYQLAENYRLISLSFRKLKTSHS